MDCKTTPERPILESLCYSSNQFAHQRLDMMPSDRSGKGESLLDFCDSFPRIETLRTGAGAIENGMAAVDAHAVVQGCLALCCAFVS